ncbi:1,4-alpha-glucan branching protein [Streptomyces sp. NPDC051742]|uniref:maltokinase N-terminal cap-like domain-containing protein n=1 Tax=unclassified Streptomyces TaxID=2593676 RepID=UPI00343D054E
MAVIHHTPMKPTKLELIAEWLPTREWSSGAEAAPEKAGGFRLDDPAGEVGIEFMAVADGEGDEAVTYLVPMTYRSGPVEGAGNALIGTMEHSVLGKRWVHDGAHDPVLIAQLYAFLTGRAQAQSQSLTDTPDPTVVVSPLAAGGAADVDLVRVTEGPDHTDVVVRTPGGAAPLTLRLQRVLRAGTDRAAGGANEDTNQDADQVSGQVDGRIVGQVTGEWRLPDGTTARGVYVVAFTDHG